MIIFEIRDTSHGELTKIDRCLDSVLESYKKLSYLELSRLPEFMDIDVAGDTGGFSVGLFREKLKNANLKIVVQGFKQNRRAIWGFVSLNTVRVKGFLIQPSGVIGEIPQKDMWEYL